MSHTSNGQGQNHLDPSTKGQMPPLVRALAVNAQEPFACAECRQNLSAIYHLAQVGQIPERYSGYLDHLRSCPYCSAEYSALAEVMAEVSAGTLPLTHVTPQFDLSFLDEPTAGPDIARGESKSEEFVAFITPWLAPAAAGLHCVSNEVRVIVTQSKATFGALPALLETWSVADSLFLAGLDQGTGFDESHVQVLALPVADADFSVRLAVGPVVADKAAMAVKIIELTTTQPLGDTWVALHDATHQSIISAYPGPDGVTLFGPLPLGRYFVQVRHNQQCWQIPLAVMKSHKERKPTLTPGALFAILELAKEPQDGSPAT